MCKLEKEFDIWNFGERSFSRIGRVYIYNDGSINFSNETPAGIKEMILAGIEFPKPFVGGGILAKIHWYFNPETITVKPCDELFAEALDYYQQQEQFYAQLAREAEV